MLQTVRKQRRLFVTDPHAPLKSFEFPGSAYKLDYFGQARLWSSGLARKRSSGCLRVPMLMLLRSLCRRWFLEVSHAGMADGIL
jgi:hypothetical protein